MTKQENKSLAEFICERREKLGMSTLGLAKKTAINPEELEDIESGKELFLAATVRQKLAKGLKLNPSDIKEYERIILVKYDSINQEYINNIKKAILQGDTENLRCPICKSKLNVKIVELPDLENNIKQHPKAQCSKCTFQIK